MIRRKLFGTNGIRGVVNDDLTPEFVIRVGCAIGTFFECGKIVVGHDCRTSGLMLTQAVIVGLTSTGCTVYDVGMAPTPAIQYAVKRHGMDGGVIITASHNPPEYNGIKVVAEDGVELPREREIEIESLFFNGKVRRVDWDKIGAIHRLPSILDVYIEAIKQHVDVNAIQRRHFHVVVDPGNGVGGLAAPYLLREMGCRVTTINANIDGTFPSRPPEPRPENLRELASALRIVKADVGVAYDGDADRSIFVDEKGEIHWGDRTFALIEKFFLQSNPGEIIVTPVSSSHLIKEIADQYGGRVVWTKVGSIIVSHVMKKLNAKLGGEENGGIFYAPHQPVRDGAMATALILDVMAKTGKKLSELLAELPLYYIEKDRLECPDDLKERALKEFIEKTKDMTIDTIDGAKIWFPDTSSILIRPSGTEPIYRFYAEGKTRNRAAQLIYEYKAKLHEIIDKSKDD
ncbi:MAG: putative phosphoglucosamine mutase [Candidatus Bathyarchaeota archaeon BA1]|nr:MAG: putative phosphoglucosamine mutase [Candidatus Bathyarchaeota archaeon BA1]